MLNESPINMYSNKKQKVTENEDSEQDDIFYDAVEVDSSPLSNQQVEKTTQQINSVVVTPLKVLHKYNHRI